MGFNIFEAHNEVLTTASFFIYSWVRITTCHTDDFTLFFSSLLAKVFDDVMSTARSVGKLPVFLMSGRC